LAKHLHRLAPDNASGSRSLLEPGFAGGNNQSAVRDEVAPSCHVLDAEGRQTEIA